MTGSSLINLKRFVASNVRPAIEAGLMLSPKRLRRRGDSFWRSRQGFRFFRNTTYYEVLWQIL
jgi:hypothetical protein